MGKVCTKCYKTTPKQLETRKLNNNKQQFIQINQNLYPLL